MKKSKDAPFEIPDALLKQLDEFSLGFCLTYINNEGSPCIITKFDNECFFLGAKDKLKMWIAAQDEMGKDMTIAEMCQGCEVEEDDEE